MRRRGERRGRAWDGLQLTVVGSVEEFEAAMQSLRRERQEAQEVRVRRLSESLGGEADAPR